MANFYCKTCDLFGKRITAPQTCRLNSSAPVGDLVQETSQSGSADKPGAVSSEPAVSTVEVPAQGGGDVLALILHIECIQEEEGNEIRDNMLEYLKLLMQDAIETNWATVKRAHSEVLQTMESGRCSWDKFESVDRIRMRCTQHILQANGNSTSGQKKEIICSGFNSNSCSYSVDHHEGKTLVKYACAHCFSLTKRF